MGGAGVAVPPGAWSLNWTVISFLAMITFHSGLSCATRLFLRLSAAALAAARIPLDSRQPPTLAASRHPRRSSLPFLRAPVRSRRFQPGRLPLALLRIAPSGIDRAARSGVKGRED